MRLTSPFSTPKNQSKAYWEVGDIGRARGSQTTLQNPEIVSTLGKFKNKKQKNNPLGMPDLTDLEWNTGIEIFNEWPGLGTTSLKFVLGGGLPDLTSKMRSTYIKNLFI